VYIGVTADQHRPLALEVIAAGKPVLVEKPFTLTAAEASEIRAAARAAGVFAMEAMWTRYLPQSDAIRMLVWQGALGDIEVVAADHGQALADDPTSRLLSLALGGGALLDLGVYPLAFTSELLGTPASIIATGDVLPSGVDGTVAMLLAYPGSTAQATLSTSISVHTPNVAAISGTAARSRSIRPSTCHRGLSWSALPTAQNRSCAGRTSRASWPMKASATRRPLWLDSSAKDAPNHRSTGSTNRWPSSVRSMPPARN
jgi:predicted dehydrogenase